MKESDLIIQNLYEALKAADYYIDRLQAAYEGKVVRDLGEAEAAYKKRGPAMIAAIENLA